MRRFKNSLMAFLATTGLILCASANVLAQDIAVTGKVTDKSGNAIIAAGVLQEGSDKGTTTNANGEYTIKVPPTATLKFVSLGYAEMKVPVSGLKGIISTN